MAIVTRTLAAGDLRDQLDMFALKLGTLVATFFLAADTALPANTLTTLITTSITVPAGSYFLLGLGQANVLQGGALGSLSVLLALGTATFESFVLQGAGAQDTLQVFAFLTPIAAGGSVTATLSALDTTAATAKKLGAQGNASTILILALLPAL